MIAVGDRVDGRAGVVVKVAVGVSVVCAVRLGGHLAVFDARELMLDTASN